MDFSDIAHEIFSYVSDACGEVGASDMALECLDGEMLVTYKRLKAENHPYPGEMIADMMFSDPDTLHDLAGDQIYDRASELKTDNLSHTEIMLGIAKELSTKDQFWKQAMDKFIRRHT